MSSRVVSFSASHLCTIANDMQIFKLLGDRPAPKWEDAQPPSQRPHLSTASGNSLQVPGGYVGFFCKN